MEQYYCHTNLVCFIMQSKVSSLPYIVVLGSCETQPFECPNTHRAVLEVLAHYIPDISMYNTC